MTESGSPRLPAAPAPGTALSLRGLCYEVGVLRILDSIDIDLDATGCTAIIGYNGAGKSVLLRLLHGLLSPTSGSITWTGGSGDAHAHRALVLQRTTLLRRSVADNIRYAMAARGIVRAEQDDRLHALLADAHLAHLADRPARVLSGGEQRRVAIAQALATAPRALLLDEPTTGLDPASMIVIESLVQRAQTAGTKVILVTQDLGQGRRLAHDVVFLHRGRVLEHTLASEFFEQPGSEPARAFVTGNLFL